jgi:Fe(3+) dicitrate transport protein
MTMNSWVSDYTRYSSRQRGGGFGTRPTGPDAQTASVEEQRFYTLGFETRLRHDYELWGGTHTIAGGLQVFASESPREDRRGNEPNARGGTLRAESERKTFYVPAFVENRFHWGALSITPGVRFENIWQSVEEKRNVERTEAGFDLADERDYEFVPLFGLGISYELAKEVELYANVSQSYRPKIYTQSVPTGGTTIVPDDLEAAKAWQYEIGFRGRPTSWATWDVSGFLLDFDNQIGTAALSGGRSTVQNVGRAQHFGVEAAAELDVIGLVDALNGRGTPAPSGLTKGKEVAPIERTLVERFGSLSLYGNVTLLDAEFVSGPFEGNTPRYAPDYLVRAGVIYRWQDRVKVAMLGTFVGESFADDGNTAERFVPSYTTWDLTAEARVYKDIVSVHAGINNVFDEDYYSRITDTGIDPGYARNYYVGLWVEVLAELVAPQAVSGGAGHLAQRLLVFWGQRVHPIPGAASRAAWMNAATRLASFRRGSALISTPLATSTANGRTCITACPTFSGVSPPARMSCSPRCCRANSAASARSATAPVPPKAPGTCASSRMCSVEKLPALAISAGSLMRSALMKGRPNSATAAQ